MKFLTFFTDTHKELYDKYFYPSYIKHFPKNDLIIEHHPNQYCKSGGYFDYGFMETQRNKINYVINITKKFQDELLVFCDTDIIFLKDFRKDLKSKIEKYTFVCQKSYTKNENYKYSKLNDVITKHSMCSGFYCFYANKQNILFLEKVLEDLKLEECNNGKKADQYYFNLNKEMLNFNLLDDTYPNTGLFSNGVAVDSSFDIPLENLKNYNLLHCNWTKDYIIKKQFMEKIYRKINEN